MDQKLKIGVIGLKGLPAFGGAASVGEQLIHELQHTIDFTVYAVSSHTDLKSGPLNNYQQIVFRKSRVRSLNTMIYFVKSMLHALFAARYDLIHIHHGSSGFIVPLLRLKYKTVVTFHGVHKKDKHDPKFNRLTNGLIRFSQWLNLRYSNKVISVSRPDADYLNNAFRKKKVLYIPNGVSIPSGESGKEIGAGYIVFAANRVYEIKGLHLLLEAMHQNNDQRRLYVIGDVEHQPEYKDRIEALSVGLNVTFTGLMRDKNKLFDFIAGAELFVFPSLTEAMSMMLLEVASLGVPLIVSDIPANKAVFTEEHVVFFRSGDMLSLSEKLLYLQNEPELAHQRARNALEQVMEQHQWPGIARSYEAIYREICNGQSA